MLNINPDKLQSS